MAGNSNVKIEGKFKQQKWWENSLKLQEMFVKQNGGEILPKTLREDSNSRNGGEILMKNGGKIPNKKSREIRNK